jgi:hypothetical protein
MQRILQMLFHRAFFAEEKRAFALATPVGGPLAVNFAARAQILGGITTPVHSQELPDVAVSRVFLPAIQCRIL